LKRDKIPEKEGEERKKGYTVHSRVGKRKQALVRPRLTGPKKKRETVRNIFKGSNANQCKMWGQGESVKVRPGGCSVGGWGSGRRRKPGQDKNARFMAKEEKKARRVPQEGGEGARKNKIKEDHTYGPRKEKGNVGTTIIGGRLSFGKSKKKE